MANVKAKAKAKAKKGPKVTDDVALTLPNLDPFKIK